MPLRLRVIPPASRHSAPPGFAAERAIDFDDGVGKIRIGRRTDLELSLPFSPLSGVHARLVRASDTGEKGDHWLLEDLGSTNGTFVGGERLKPGVKLAVTAGMQIKVAEVCLIFDGEVRPGTEGEGLTRVAGAVHNEPSNKVAAKVHNEPSNKVAAKVHNEPSNKVAAKAHNEPSNKVAAKAHNEASNKVAAKVQAEASNKVTGKVQAEASSKVTGKTPSEGSGKSGSAGDGGKVQAEAPNKVTAKTVSEVSGKSASKVPAHDPTQTYVRGQQTDVHASAPSVAQVPYLTPVSGTIQGTMTFRLEQRDHVYMFGRTRRCEFRVDTAEVSREHASFERRGDGIYVNDLGSVNGVLVNNTRVKEYRLLDGDLIQVGHIKLRLFDPSEPAPRESERPSASPLSRGTPPQTVPSHGMHAHVQVTGHHPPPEPASRSYEPPPVRGDASATFRSDFHPAIAGALAAEGEPTYRRRPSVRIRLQETWEKSSGFRYVIVIVAASLLAVCAVIVGFTLAG
jgi:pSer/pThr/pTyr-binding forkhead associated (FHA) protein